MLAAVILIIAAVFAIVRPNISKGYRNISVTEVSGQVTVSANGKEYDAYKDLHISDGYSLTTFIKSYIRLALDSDKYVKLEEESRAVFSKVGSSKNKNTQIDIEYGTLTTEITKPLLENESYVVNTPNSVLAVRGTLFMVYVNYDENGVAYTDVFTYGGSVACKRVLPDGTVVDEDVIVNAGYKTRIKTDDKDTVYIEETIDGSSKNVCPIDPSEIPDDDLVLIYDASLKGHSMFMSTEEIWNEIE